MSGPQFSLLKVAGSCPLLPGTEKMDVNRRSGNFEQLWATSLHHWATSSNFRQHLYTNEQHRSCFWELGNTKGAARRLRMTPLKSVVLQTP